MAITYIDTSALFRLVAQEGDIAPVETALTQGPISSSLTVLEMRAGFYKRWHDGELTDVRRNDLLQTVRDVIDPVLTLVPLDESVLAEAGVVVESYSLRALDAIHFGTALIASRHARRQGAEFRFCTADRRQGAAAASAFGSEHVTVVPPWR